MSDEAPPYIDVIGLVTDESIKYLPRLNPHTGSKEATILLLRCLHWWVWTKAEGRDRFFKFDAPCKHDLYRPRDSWEEELGFSRRELDTARSKIATRLNMGREKAAIMERAEPLATDCVMFYTTAKRVTYYEINERAIIHLFAKSYLRNVHYLSSGGNVHQESVSNGENVHYLSSGGNAHYLSLHNKELQDSTNTNPARLRTRKGNVVSENSISETKAKARATKKPKTPKDPRRSHHSLGLIAQALGHFPKKLYWDPIIELGDPDKSGRNCLEKQKVIDLIMIAQSVGCFEGNLSVWLLDWYVNGVPDKYMGRPITNQLASKYRRKEGVSGTTEGSGAGRLRKGINE